MAWSRVQQATAQGTGGSSSMALAAGATAGNVLISVVNVAGATSVITDPPGWTRLAGAEAFGPSTAVAYKVAVGGETLGDWTWTVGGQRHSEWMAEYTGETLKAGLPAVSTNFTDDSSVTSVITGPIVSSVNAIGIAINGTAASGYWDLSHSWDDGFTTAAEAGSGSQPLTLVADRVMTGGGTANPTNTTTDTGGNASGVLVVLEIAGPAGAPINVKQGGTFASGAHNTKEAGTFKPTPLNVQ